MPLPRLARYPVIGGIISFDAMPLGTSHEVVRVQAEDRGESKGVLYTKGGEKTVVCLMHPRADMSRHYLTPYLIEAGYAVFGQESRWPGNDVACIHEMLLADIAAGNRYLKERGFQKIVFIGNSGGGSLYSFYQAQAVTNPPDRLKETAAGDPYDLNRFTMPPADGLIILAAHLGEGKYLQNSIDPSIADENDPLSCDAALDMYSPANGFREPPEPSRYGAEFLQRYRAGQAARVARLDAIARRHVEEQRHFQELARQPEFDRLPLERRTFIGRRALLGSCMVIHRTEANPAFTDPSITPSSRDYGSIFSPRPDLFNYCEGGFAKYMTPRGWLSTWSGLASRAAVLDNIPKITIPTLVVNYTGDHSIYPADSEAILDRAGTTDKKIAHIDADHFGFPLASKPDQGGRASAAKAIAAWLRDRFPAR
jgi:esterase/lipase